MSRKKYPPCDPAVTSSKNGEFVVFCCSAQRQWLDAAAFWFMLSGFTFFAFAIFMIGMDFLIMDGDLQETYLAALLIPLPWALLGLHFYRSATKGQTLYFSEAGLRLDNGEVWSWGQFMLQIELRMADSSLFKSVQTQHLANTVAAVFYLHLPGKPTVRMHSLPKYMHSNIYDPGVRFRVELGKLLAYLQAEATAPIFPSSDWKNGAVFYPMNAFATLFFPTLLMGLALMLVALEDGGRPFALFLGVLCLGYCGFNVLLKVDRVVVDSNGISSLRYGKISWRNISLVDQGTHKRMAWDQKRYHSGGHPEGIADESYVATALAFSTITHSGEIDHTWKNLEGMTLYSWTYWPLSSHRAARFAMFCNAQMLRQKGN